VSWQPGTQGKTNAEAVKESASVKVYPAVFKASGSNPASYNQKLDTFIKGSLKLLLMLILTGTALKIRSEYRCQKIFTIPAGV
jgi:hypothetical protein